MGEISFSTSLLLVIVLFIGFIAIFPEKLCLPFSDICVFLEPLHYLKNLLFYFGAVFLYFAMLFSFGLLLTRTFNFFKRNAFIVDLIMFLITFDEKTYYNLKKSLSARIR